MNVPSEHDYIDKCKLLIECRLEWADNLEWKNRDYEYLSELIFEKTRISISVSTLKRIWQNNKHRIPHVSTLNALARFLDYENWHDFKNRLKNEIKPVENPEVIVKQKKKIGFLVIMITISFVVIISIAFYLFQKQMNNKKHTLNFDPDDIVFTSRKTVTSGLPNSVVFYYDISKADFDSAFIQQDWDKRKRQKISKDGHYHTSIYYYPQYYEAKLVLHDSIVKRFPFHITTEGWMALYEKSFLNGIPIYFKNIDIVKGNRLFVSMEDLEMNKIENDKDFFISFYNARDFGEVYCNNFSLESEIKNDPKDGGLTCQFAGITVMGENGMMLATFSDPGCTSELELVFSDYILNGSNSDLSAFGTDLSQWRNIKYEVNDKNVTIYIDHKEVSHFSYKKDIGKLVGIAYHFYGCGSVRMSKLYNKDDQLVYEEQFDNRYKSTK
jgi:transcriptional regulator with XRE-family HTH domain